MNPSTIQIISKKLGQTLKIQLLLLLLLFSLQIFYCSPNKETEQNTTESTTDTMDSISGNHPPVLLSIGDKQATPGLSLIFLVKATDPDNDPLTFAVYGDLPEGAQFGPAESGSMEQKFSWTPLESDSDFEVFITFSVSDGQADDRETIRLSITETSSCIDDVFDQPPFNNTYHTATTIPEGTTEQLKLCPEDHDWFAFTTDESVKLEVLVTHDITEGDLDLEFFDPSEQLLKRSETTGNNETIIIPYTPAPGTYRVHIYGWEQDSANYTLTLQISDGIPCDPDLAEVQGGNDSSWSAWPVATDTELEGLTLCGDPDWYIIPMEAGNSLMTDIVYATTDIPPVLRIYHPDRVQLLAEGESFTEINTIRAELEEIEEPGNYLIQVIGTEIGQNYSLKIMLNPFSDICTPLSCEEGRVCGDNGECQSDFCATETNCPALSICLDNICLTPCENNESCRNHFGEFCKFFWFDPNGYCSPARNAQIGDPCTSWRDCAGSAICMDTPGGICMLLGCSSQEHCPIGSACGLSTDGGICSASCQQDSDCRNTEGYECLEFSTPEGETAGLCTIP